MSDISIFLNAMHKHGASDLCLVSGKPPLLRIMEDIIPLKYRELKDDEIRKQIYEIAPKEKLSLFEKNGETRFIWQPSEKNRYAVSMYLQYHGISAVFRDLPCEIPPPENLGIPPQIISLAQSKSGLVILSGGKRSGKSVTMNTLIAEANKTREGHIITIEDPVEFVHKNQKCRIDQREVGVHTRSFQTGIREAMAEKPDIIMIGETDTPETISPALEAASDSLVITAFPRCSTRSASILDQILELFPAKECKRMRFLLADRLCALIHQVLLRRSDTNARCAAFDILFGVQEIKELIRSGKTILIPGYMLEKGKEHGMKLLDDALMELYEKGHISGNDAFHHAHDKGRFRKYLAGEPADFTLDCIPDFCKKSE